MRFDATLMEKDNKIEHLSNQLEARSAKLAHAASAARIAQNEKAALERSLAEAKERNDKLNAVQEKEFSARKKELLAKAAQFKRMASPVLKEKDSTVEAINDSKAKLYKALNLMSAFPFHSDNFANANAAMKSSVSLLVAYPPALGNNQAVSQKAKDSVVRNGTKLLASTVEVAPRITIDSSAIEGIFF